MSRMLPLAVGFRQIRDDAVRNIVGRCIRRLLVACWHTVYDHAFVVAFGLLMKI